MRIVLTQPAPAPECGTFDLSCQAGQAAGSAFDSLVASAADGAAELVVMASTWWVETDSVDPTDSAVLAAQGVTTGVVGLVLVGSVLVQAIRLILSRKAEPLIMVATGLFRFTVVSALGLLVLQSALLAGDALAAEILDGAANSFALLMRDALTADQDNAFIVLLVAVAAAVLALVQWVLMALRQAGLLVLAAMLPLAASGSLTRSARGWLDRLLGWLIAIVAYKPAAAFIYYIGFSYLSSPSAEDPGGVATMITGLMVLFLAVIAMPVMLRFFSWSGTQIGGGNAGGSGLIGAAGAVALSQSYARSPAVTRAAATETSGPGSVPTHGGPGAGGPPAGAAASGGQGAGMAASRAAGAAGAAGAVIATGAAAARSAGDRMTEGNPPEGDPR